MYTKPQKTIYFFRHAQSDENINQNKNIHASDQYLTELGKLQATQLAHRITNLQLPGLLSSTLTRAKETSEIMSSIINVDIEYSDLFIEKQKPSSIIGQIRQEPSILAVEQRWINSLFTPNTQIEDGDSYDSILNRAEQAIEFLKSKPEAVLGVVTHQFFLNALIIKVILGETINPEIYTRLQEQYWLENTGIVILHYHPEYPYTGWKVITYNDTAHLDYLKSHP
ncbi:MAG: histidine phosphatase family protein [Minisyncoccia bacterium]